MAFRKAGSLAPWGGPVLRQDIMQNADVFTEDDLCKVDTSGFLTTDSMPAAGVYGHVDTIVTEFGVGALQVQELYLLQLQLLHSCIG